jgi:hypothetical protein
MPTPPPTVPSAEDRSARQMAMLRELAELGMELARALGAQALAELNPQDTDTPKVTTADPVLTFTRVARAVRQTVALEMRIGRADTQDQAEDDRAFHRYEQIARKVLVHEIATDAITLHAEDDDGRRERLLRALDDRLEHERPDDEANYAYLPINTLVTRICRDLGVQPDWSLWAERAIVADEEEGWPDAPAPAGRGPPPAPRQDAAPP